MTDVSSAQWVAATRAASGLILLVRPESVMKVILARADQRSTVARRVARVLGARLLVQSGIELSRPTPTVLTLGAVVDGIHALSALGLAAFGGSRWRRAALANTATALCFCAATAATASPDRHQGANR
ncbi:MAG: hypothetical protein M3Z25_08515 [Actinomycetota bacterium]|nr:hypothetical protein [Actinomycetota bacterium]